MLIFPLKKEWYEKIRSGEKTVEYREVKPYWNNRILVYTGVPMPFFRNIEFFRSRRPRCILRLGYTKRQMTADITKIGVVDGKDTDLRVDKPVYAIHLANVRDAE
ncbi:MAG: hypothetical protein K2N31_10560 [Treponemataceae bacterium]|nr:hypothetical protein [Treponemataceae bacterium]